MAKLSETLKHNVVTAAVVVCLPIIVALAITGYMTYRGQHDGWGYSFIAMLAALLIQYPYLKICDRYVFK